MADISNMYQTSLHQYLRIFDSALDGEVTVESKRRISYIIENLTTKVINFMARSLFERDRNIFILQLALRIDLAAGNIMPDEFTFLAKGGMLRERERQALLLPYSYFFLFLIGSSLSMDSVQDKKLSWLPDSIWLNLIALSKLYQFKDLLDSVIRSEKIWKRWYNLDASEIMSVPDTGLDLSIFHKLLLLRGWCPEKCMIAARQYVAMTLGERFVSGYLLDMEGRNMFQK
jgi:dynein heavy chain